MGDLATGEHVRPIEHPAPGMGSESGPELGEFRRSQLAATEALDLACPPKDVGKMGMPDAVRDSHFLNPSARLLSAPAVLLHRSEGPYRGSERSSVLTASPVHGRRPCSDGMLQIKLHKV